MAKTKRVSIDKVDSSGPGEGNPDLVEYKERLGLPRWQDLTKELEQLREKHGASWAEELHAKIDLHRKYLEYQGLLYQNYNGLGLQHINALQNAIELQVNLFALQEKLQSQGINPLESKEYMVARDMLGKEMQWLHKHKLDVAQFQHQVTSKRSTKDDDLFVVEANADDGRPER